MSNILNQTSKAFDLFMDELGEAPEPDINAGGKLPGISPGGKGTANTATFDAPRPYLSKGTGYKLLRSKPGYSKLRKSLHGLGRYSYGPMKYPNGIINHDIKAVKTRRSPRSLMAVQDDIKSLKRSAEMAMDTMHSLMNSDRAPGGQYNRALDVIVYPENDKWGVKRHEITHALQNRRRYPKGFQKGYREPMKFADDALDIVMKGQEPANYLKFKPKTSELLTETEARIVEKKSIRDGLKGYARDIDATFDDGSKFYSQKGRAISKALGKAAEALPDKPGRFTGRVPNFHGFGAGLVDMFMEGPALQEAKTNPLVGMGNRAEIEAAYEYGL